MPLLTSVGTKGLPDPAPGLVATWLGLGHNHSICWGTQSHPQLSGAQNSASQDMQTPVATGWALPLVNHKETEEQGQDGGLASSYACGFWQVLHE